MEDVAERLRIAEQENPDLRNLLHGAVTMGKCAAKNSDDAEALIKNAAGLAECIRALPCVQTQDRKRLETALFSALSSAMVQPPIPFIWPDLDPYPLPEEGA